MDCGYTWAEWSSVVELLNPAQCETDGSTSSFIRPCSFINETHETLTSSTAPVAANCADEDEVLKTLRMVALDGNNCKYLTLRDETQINGQVIGQQVCWKINLRLKFNCSGPATKNHPAGLRVSKWKQV